MRKLQFSAPLGRPTTRRGESVDGAPSAVGRNPMAGGIGYEKPSLYRQFSLQPMVTTAAEECRRKGEDMLT